MAGSWGTLKSFKEGVSVPFGRIQNWKKQDHYERCPRALCTRSGVNLWMHEGGGGGRGWEKRVNEWTEKPEGSVYNEVISGDEERNVRNAGANLYTDEWASLWVNQQPRTVVTYGWNPSRCQPKCPAATHTTAGRGHNPPLCLWEFHGGSKHGLWYCSEQSSFQLHRNYGTHTVNPGLHLCNLKNVFNNVKV